MNFQTPQKLVNEQSDMPKWEASPARAKLEALVNSLSNQVTGMEVGTTAKTDVIKELVSWLHKVGELTISIEPLQEQQRFGNPRFRDWVSAMTEKVTELHFRLDKVPTEAWAELGHYLANSFGSAQRLDYGTGHELNFLAFTGGLLMLGYEWPGSDTLLLWASYLDVCRRLIHRYNLEPAGSHGVWGLDDHFHIPYILGAAELAPLSRGADPTPKTVLDRKLVAEQAPYNLYFGAVNFVYEVKRGNFFEHSPVLYDVSGVQTWSKTRLGMIKMYHVEVLGKYPVIQHFWFGGLYPLE